MDARSIFWPGIAMVALTFVAPVRVYVARIGEVRQERIPPQAVPTSTQAAARFEDTRAHAALPVLRYVLAFGWFE